MRATEDTQHKFSNTGDVLRFQGNTVICSVNESTGPIYGELVRAQRQLQELPSAEKYAYLPATTFHMTAIRLTDQTHRNTPLWPASFAADCDMAEIDRKYKSVVDPISKPVAFRMKVDSCTASRVNLSAFDEETRMELVRFREEIATATGVRFSDHDAYTFHMTLGYRLRKLTPAEQRREDEVVAEITRRLTSVVEYFEPGAPEFVVFNDMHAFYTDLGARD